MSSTIVIVDDDGITLDLMVAIIEENFDAVVYSFTDARLTKTFLADNGAQKLDLIIADMYMPRLSGIDLLTFIKNQSLDVPVLMVSGEVTKDNVIKVARSGASGFIGKPFNKQDFIKKTKELLR